MFYVTDPIIQIKVLNEKIKEMEKHIETLNMECIRWKDESSELSLKCKTFESQLEQRQSEYKQQISIREVFEFYINWNLHIYK